MSFSARSHASSRFSLLFLGDLPIPAQSGGIILEGQINLHSQNLIVECGSVYRIATSATSGLNSAKPIHPAARSAENANISHHPTRLVTASQQRDVFLAATG